jgi:MFS family permease
MLLQESLITSVVFLGTMLGANAWGALSDARGRRVGFQVRVRRDVRSNMQVTRHPVQLA